jgi:hypothetical protein
MANAGNGGLALPDRHTHSRPPDLRGPARNGCLLQPTARHIHLSLFAGKQTAALENETAVPIWMPAT